MSKKITSFFRILLVLAVSLNLTGCFAMESILAIDKTLPRTPVLDLAPYWVFDTAYSLNPDNQEIDKDYFKGLGAYLSKDRIIIGTDSVDHPTMKVMQVSTYEYFLTRYKIAPADVGLTEASMKVYTVTDAKGFSVRIYELKPERIAIERNNILLYFDRTDHLEKTNIKVSTDSMGNPTKSPPSTANGVLLGLRSARTDQNGKPGAATYRTLWISYQNGQPLTIYEVENILFPRNVFYQLSVDRQENADVVRETIVIKNLADQTIVQESAPADGLSRRSDITFISNDYFSTVSGVAKYKDFKDLTEYSTRNVGKPDYDNRIGITDLFGPEGINVMESAAKIALANQEAGETAGLGELRENSFILKRYNGRWIYEGRINAQNANSQKNLTYPMNFRDNYRVYRYDDLEPRWSEIRSLVPDALDAVSSPDRFFTLIRTKSRLLVYSRLKDGRLAAEPMARIELSNEEIIMHEWALGNYVTEWTKVVKPLGKKLQ
ncbi:hypothetical protein [Proteiniclasticum sp. QWL-01]|uniref:hypothetical protein n=1 Tax=Proteiniclasticum sp. QWL-01 TaxID=3036945 RepID=UPI00220891FF|nr:hypothetical protein [Proteiniclasticum sp. QWL-01]UUM10740.1 hypothetical protein NQU17_08580 [Clostridiaceae bacterium HFYG-1003]WFF72075.1 hypothetical protein P6M73_12290 [Proteiniclasticum sp. QWL-01]